MGMISTNSYTPPVNQLLTYGNAQIASLDEWPNYLELGLGSEQIPDLIRMVTDEGLNGVVDPEISRLLGSDACLGERSDNYVPRQRLSRCSRSSMPQPWMGTIGCWRRCQWSSP